MKYGILSTASIAGRFIAGVRESGLDEVCAIASRSSQKAEDFAARENIPTAYGNYQQLFEDEDLDIIYIPTVNVNHYRDGCQALEHGKHVVMEKPFTLTSADAEELFKLAEEKNCFLMEGQKAVFLPVSEDLKDLLQKQEIGELRYIDFKMSHTNHPLDHWMYQPAMGGGALYGSGSYIIEYLLYLLDDPKLQISGYCQRAASGTDTIAAFHLKTDKDVLINATIATNVEFVSEVVFYGTKGNITVQNFWKADRLSINYNDGTSRQHCFPQKSEFAFEARHIHECLEKGLLQSPRMNAQRTIECVRLVEQLQKQWKENEE